MRLTFCVSCAANPEKMMTPKILGIVSRTEFIVNKFTTNAGMTPNKHIVKMLPTEVKSVFVTYPERLINPNMAAVINVT